MVARKCDDGGLLEAYAELRSVQRCASKFNMSTRVVYGRLKKLGITFIRNGGIPDPKSTYNTAPGRILLDIPNGKVVVFSDCHYWPGYLSTAHRALLKLIPVIKPRAAICAGDAFDGSSISRHPRIGWDKCPTVLEELNVTKERLGEIEVLLNGNNLYWTLGNHDARHETYLAAAAPQYEGVPGFHLKDHFPLWKPCWSVWLNNNTVVKHFWKSGIHAPHNNTIGSGMSMVTGHLHSQKVSPWSDYNGTRYGVDTGCVADPYGPQFEYAQDNPVNWRSGFAVLTYHEGKLLHPQLVTVLADGVVEYLGDVIQV